MIDKNNCEQLPLYTEGLLSDSDKRAFEEHLMDCEACNNQIEECRIVMSSVREIVNPKPPQYIWHNIASQISLIKESEGLFQISFGELLHFWKFRIAGIAFAALTVIFLFVYFMTPDLSEDMNAYFLNDYVKSAKELKFDRGLNLSQAIQQMHRSPNIPHQLPHGLQLKKIETVIYNSAEWISYSYTSFNNVLVIYRQVEAEGNNQGSGDFFEAKNDVTPGINMVRQSVNGHLFLSLSNQEPWQIVLQTKAFLDCYYDSNLNQPDFNT